jgi:hypothetical protein
MGRKRKKGKLSKFVAIPWELIDSEAWINLSNAARVALIHLKRKVNCPNPGEIYLSYNEMEKIMNRHTFSNAIKQLEEKGFIEVVKKGGLYRLRNAFKLSEKWRFFKTEISSAKNGTTTSAKSGTIE